MSEIIGLNTRLYGNNLLIKEPSLQETEEEEEESVIVPEQSFTSDEIKYSIIEQKFVKEQSNTPRISANVAKIGEQATINVVFDDEMYEEVPVTVDGGYAIFGDIDFTTYPFYVTGQTKDDYMFIGCAQGVHTIDAYCDGDIQPYPTASLEDCEALEEFDGDLLVLFDDVKYHAPKRELSEQIYWGASYIGEDEGFDWDECPFVILYRDGGEIYTETEGEHTITATVYVPIQRVDMPIVSEHYMKDYVEGHGGSSSPLPEVTSDDNGDVLTVVEGAWGKAAPAGVGKVYTFSDTYGQALQTQIANAVMSMYTGDKTDFYGEYTDLFTNNDADILQDLCEAPARGEVAYVNILGNVLNPLILNVFEDIPKYAAVTYIPCHSVTVGQETWHLSITTMTVLNQGSKYTTLLINVIHKTSSME